MAWAPYRRRFDRTVHRSFGVAFAFLFVLLCAEPASAELPRTASAALETQHAESHGEPSDAELEEFWKHARQNEATFRGNSLSISVGLPNRGYLQQGVFLADSDVLKVKIGSRTTRHGTQEMVDLIEYAAQEVAHRYPNAELNVGDLSREKGGRLYPHKSHRSGRDVDLGFYMLNSRKKPTNLKTLARVNSKGLSFLNGTHYRFDEERNWALVAALLSHPTIDVQHIFVANTIRRRLLRQAVREKADRDLVRRAMVVLRQPKRGQPHRSHFHVRIFCADTDKPDCEDVSPFYAWHPRETPEGPDSGRMAKAEPATGQAPMVDDTIDP